jgi:ATP-dependent Clp protease ATP-binding subunit ClpC
MQHKLTPFSNAAPFTQNSQQVLNAASEEASALHHRTIGTEHVLLAVMHVATSEAAQVLFAHGVTLNAARQVVMALNTDVAPEPQVLAFAPDAQRALQAAMQEAQQRQHRSVNTLHLLCGLLHEHATGAARVLQHLGVPPEQVRADVEQRLSCQDAEDAKN